MKKLKNIEELESLLKEQLAKAEIPAPPDVWSGVSASVGYSANILSQFSTYFSSLGNIAKIAIVTGGIGGAGLLIYTQIPEDKNQTPIEFQEQAIGENNEVIFSPEDEISEERSIVTEQNEQTEEKLKKDPVNSLTNPKNKVSSAAVQTENSINSLETGTKPTSVENRNTQGKEHQGINSQEELPKILCSDPAGCIGSTQHFKTDRAVSGTWYINGVEVKRNAAEMEHHFDRTGTHLIAFRNKSGKTAEFNYHVGAEKIEILTSDIGDGQWRIGTDKAVDSYQWLINGVELSSQSELTTELKTGVNDIVLKTQLKGCPYETSTRIDIQTSGSISIPTIFTPNNDGKNDEYLVDIENYSYFHLQIFDGNGKVMFETQNPTIGWNGFLHNEGMECPNGNYRVSLRYKLNGEKLKIEYAKLTLTR